MVETLYHGSDKVIKKPLFGYGKEDNDYGSGFYTTKTKERANEWALANGTNTSICNIYEIDTEGLAVLNLDEYGTLSWIAEVASHRGTKNSITVEISNRLIEKYKIDTSNADIINGYRADDSYIDVVEAFLKNELSIDEVERLFRKGNLGEQVFIKSEEAFNRIAFIGYEVVKPSFGSNYAISPNEAKARHEVNNFLNNRRSEIALNGYTPVGITARVAINSNFVYNKEYRLYTEVDKLQLQNNNTEQEQSLSKSEAKRKKKYELEL